MFSHAVWFMPDTEVVCLHFAPYVGCLLHDTIYPSVPSKEW